MGRLYPPEDGTMTTTFDSILDHNNLNVILVMFLVIQEIWVMFLAIQAILVMFLGDPEDASDLRLSNSANEIWW